MMRKKSNGSESVRWVLIDIRGDAAISIDDMKRKYKTTRAKIVRRAIDKYLLSKKDDDPDKRRKIIYDVIKLKSQSKAAILNGVSKQYVSTVVRELKV